MFSDSLLYKRSHFCSLILPIAHIFRHNRKLNIITIIIILVPSYLFVFQFSQPWPSLVYILPIISFAVIYNIPKFFELQVTSKKLKNSGFGANVEEEDFSQTYDDESLVLGNQNSSHSADLILVNQYLLLYI